MSSPVNFTPEGKPLPDAVWHRAEAQQEDDGKWRGVVVHGDSIPHQKWGTIAPATTTLSKRWPTEALAKTNAQAHADELNARIVKVDES